MPNASGSVSQLISSLRCGDSTAQQQIWDRYYARLTAVARSRLRNSPMAVADDDDVVAQAIWNVLRRIESGQYDSLRNSDELWRVLATTTIHEAVSQIRYLLRRRRFSKALPVNLSCVASTDDANTLEASDFLAFILGALPDDDARRVFVLRLEDYSVGEIAREMERSVPTIERRLRRIRDVVTGIISDA